MMKKIAFLIFLFVPAARTHANPVVDPFSLTMNGIAVSLSLLFEILVTTGILLFCSLALKPVFAALLIGNIASFFGVLLPLEPVIPSVLCLEIIVVIIESVYLKVICSWEVFQEDSFSSFKWRYAFLATITGNACSYFVGDLMII